MAVAGSGVPTVADSESTEMDTRASGYLCRKLTACQSCPDEMTPVEGIDFLQPHEPDASLREDELGKHTLQGSHYGGSARGGP